WLLGYWGFLGLLAAVEIIRFVTASARPTVALIGGVIDVAMAVFLTIAMLTQPVLHPELTRASGADVQQVITVIAIWIIVVWDQVTTWRTVRGCDDGELLVPGQLLAVTDDGLEPVAVAQMSVEHGDHDPVRRQVPGRRSHHRRSGVGLDRRALMEGRVEDDEVEGAQLRDTRIVRVRG